MSKQRMMSDVPDADVVVTNPTHYAVALQYDDQKSSAPIVVAKGIDFLALKIKDIARESKIPIIEDPALARAIYEQVEVEQEIPEVFYKPIAEIFTYIFNLNKGK
jgi:flagellar biosynthetic protein FlhB